MRLPLAFWRSLFARMERSAFHYMIVRGKVDRDEMRRRDG